MGDLLTHDSLSTFLANFAVDEAQDAIVHIEGALPLEGESFLFLQSKFEPEFLANVGLFQFEFRR